MFYIFLANGFEEIEALCPYDLLLRADIDVKTVSVNETKRVTGTHGIAVEADALISELDLDGDFSGIMLPGGMPGASNLEANEKVQAFITKANEEGKLITAICAAPFILGNRGLLEGKEAVCFPGFEEYLKGAVISDKKVVTCGNIITAKGMGVAFDFGIETVKYFKGEEFALELKAKTQA
ncbi:MAG: DJ-1/PfpI family protein [Ruminococcaceae bacterium]|nr:DJ-1/PfpI family protein [Oscillospiraceae bacterium]